MGPYTSLYRQYKDQDVGQVFAHFYATKNGDEPDYDGPFKVIAAKTSDGLDAWSFQQEFFRARNRGDVPKLKNYLFYTFGRLLELERHEPGKYFRFSDDGQWAAFNTGLQTPHHTDLIAIFQRYVPHANAQEGPGQRRPDWVFKGCCPPNESLYHSHFGKIVPDIAWYSKDSRDYIFDVTYDLETDLFDHLFERAKERAGLADSPDESVRYYLAGAFNSLIPKIKRNYKVAIPVWYVEVKRMQLLLPFYSAKGDISCFVVDRDDTDRTYRVKTIFDLDKAFFSARLITRPDKEWLDP